MATAEALVVMGGSSAFSPSLRALKAERPKSAAQVREAFERNRAGSLWVCFDLDDAVRALVDVAPQKLSAQRLLIACHAQSAEVEFLRTLFSRVAAEEGPWRLLPHKDLLAALAVAHPEDLLIGVANVPENETLLLLRGNLERLTVPWSWFKGGPRSPVPDFADEDIIDGGNAVRLGKFEASADAILYEFAPDYRKRLKAKRLVEERSFGASLRRLRLQRRVGRDEFKGISGKEIARLERGEVEKPHPATKELIAKRLGVAPDEIEQY